MRMRVGEQRDEGIGARIWANLLHPAALPKPKEGEEGVETPMPQTLVRIPTHQAGLLNQETGEVPGGGVGPE